MKFPVIAHSETQAKKRTGDLMDFLGSWMAHEDGPHPAVLYFDDQGTVVDATFVEEVVNETGDLGRNMVSANEHLFSWWDPYSDVDYDPRDLAEQSYRMARDED